MKKKIIEQLDSLDSTNNSDALGWSRYLEQASLKRSGY